MNREREQENIISVLLGYAVLLIVVISVSPLAIGYAFLTSRTFWAFALGSAFTVMLLHFL